MLQQPLVDEGVAAQPTPVLPKPSLIQPRAQKLLDSLAAKTGLNIQMDESLPATHEGAFDPATNTIRFNPGADAGDMALGVIKHELTHFAEGSPDYQRYADFVINHEYGDSKAELNDAIREKIDLYKKNGVKQDEDSAKREVVAELTRDVFLRSDADMGKLVREETGLANRLKNFVNDAVDGIGAWMKTEDDLREWDMLRKAQDFLNLAIKTVSPDTDAGTQFSIKRDIMGS
ncbi:hypothetical protein AGMMS49992_32170 [Clostridia bacterium]|nr:hypothetical protein AGMMS49992_32170 [Clostridia bacterium]